MQGVFTAIEAMVYTQPFIWGVIVGVGIRTVVGFMVRRFWT